MGWSGLLSIIETQIVLVNARSADCDVKGWLAITWPMYLGCVTGMNSKRVTVAFGKPGKPAPSRKHVTLDATQLLAGK